MKRTTLLAITFLLVLSLLLGGCAPKETASPAPVDETPAEQAVEPAEETPVATEPVADPAVSKDGVNYFEKFGITDNGETITFQDSREKDITVPKHPKKVANLYNSYLSLWSLMGGEVVAVVEQADEKPVEGIEQAELVGKPSEPNVEKIIEIDPDLIFIAPFSANIEVADTFNDMGIPTVYMEVKSKNDYYRLVRIFAAILDDESQFEKYALDIENSIQDLLAKVPAEEPQKILLMMSTTRGVSVKNNQSLNGEMLTDLNTLNIADNAVTGDKSEEMSMEQIVIEDPDVIFVTEMGSDLEAIAKKRQEILESDPVWGELSAVKNGRYHVLPKDLFTYKPNENYLEAYTILAKLLYPEVFGE